MKLTIDVPKKTIQFHDEIELDELITFLETQLVNWKEYKIIPSQQIVTVKEIEYVPSIQPYTIPVPYIPDIPYTPWKPTIWYYSNEQYTCKLSNDINQIEIK